MTERRVLLVDDDPDMTRLLALNLEMAGGYQVQSLNEPLEAVALAREFQPDVIILDMNMPSLSGAELAEQMADDPELFKIPRLFLTGSAVDPGRSDQLQKPVKLADLLASIQAVLV